MSAPTLAPTQPVEVQVTLPNGMADLAAGTLAPSRSGSIGALCLEAVPDSVAHGRHWVVTLAEALGVSGDAVLVVELLTSELVTNAVRHGPSAGVITLRAALHGNAMSITVSDESHVCPVLCAPAPEDLGGRGLLLVEALAADWGVELHDGDGKSVWFRVQLDADAA